MFPTDDYTPDQVTYQFVIRDDQFNSSTVTVNGTGWSPFTGWQDALEAAAVAFRDSLLASLADVPGINATGTRQITAAVSSPVAD